MPKLRIDTPRLTRLVFVDAVTPLLSLTPTKHYDCTLETLVNLHPTRVQTDYLTNAIHYHGAPLVYTHNNAVSSFFGKRARLTYVPSIQPLRTATAIGAMYGVGKLMEGLMEVRKQMKDDDNSDDESDESDDSNNDADSDDESETSTKKKTKKASASILHTLKRVFGVPTLALAGVAASYILPYQRLLSQCKDYIPFSTYDMVTAGATATGRWHVLYQYDRNSGRYVMVVVAPLPQQTPAATSGATGAGTARPRYPPNSTTVIDWCAVRIRSRPTYTYTFRPHTAEMLVVRAPATDIRRVLDHWDTLVGAFDQMWTHSGAFGVTGVTTQTLHAYNAAHSDEQYDHTLSIHAPNVCLPMLAFSDARETKALNKTGKYTAILNTRDSLPQIVQDNVCYRWHPLSDYNPRQYVHASQLHHASVSHVLAVPFDPVSAPAMTSNERGAEVAYVEQVKALLHQPTRSRRTRGARPRTLHRKQLDTLVVPARHQRWLFVALSSRRINNHIDFTVQLFQPERARLYTCLLPDTVTLADVHDALDQQTDLGGEAFAFRPSSAFVQQYHPRLYDADAVTATQRRLHAKTRRKLTRREAKLTAKKTLRDAKRVVQQDRERLLQQQLDDAHAWARDLPRYRRRHREMKRDIRHHLAAPTRHITRVLPRR